MEQKYIIRGSEGDYYLAYMQGETHDREYAYQYTTDEISENLDEYPSWLEGCTLIPIVPYNKEKQDEK